MNDTTPYLDEYLRLVETNRGNRIDDPSLQVHHVTPRSIGGADDPDNLVALTPKDHVLAHELLFKHYAFCVSKVARAYVSMLPGGLASAAQLPDGFDSTVADAYAMIRKRTVLCLDDLSEKRIGAMDPLPEGFIEKPSPVDGMGNRRIDVFSRKTFAVGRWPKGVALPEGWFPTVAATVDELDRIDPGWKDQLRQPKRPAGSLKKQSSSADRLAYNPRTGEQMMFDKIPLGWVSGNAPNPEEVLRSRTGADRAALQNKRLSDECRAAIQADLDETVRMLETRDWSGYEADPWKYGVQTYRGVTLKTGKWAKAFGITASRMKDMRRVGMSF